MSSSRRSLITWSPGFASGGYDTNLVTAGLDMLEVGARQLNDQRLRELPDFLPFCQPGVPLNTPISSLATTSSLPTTWSVHKPPSLKRRLCPAKRLGCHITVDLRGTGTKFQTFVPSAFLTLHQTPFSNRSTRGFINGHLQLSFALPKTFEKPLKPLALPLFHHFPSFSKTLSFFFCNLRSFSTLSISNFLQYSSDHKKVTLLLLLLMFAAF